MKQIAVIGAGFCGLAAAWHLSQCHPHARLVLFDAQPIGKSTSGLAAGLLHPFAGAHAKRSYRATEGMAAALELFAVAEKALGCSVAALTGLLRPALTHAQREDFSLCQEKYGEEVQWRTAAQCQESLPGSVSSPGIFIEQAFVVDCSKYLEGLWKAVSDKGMEWNQTQVSSLKELQEFDRVVVAAGAATQLLPELSGLPLRTVKGQLLECSWPDEVPPLPYPLSSQCYLLMNGPKKCIAGATFERGFADAGEDLETACREILPKVQAFFPLLQREHVLRCRAGLRSTTPDHLPLLKQVSEKCWVLAGMGSKGLLYHALYAKILSQNCLLC
jgi:glycine/D-amino acid oxidase-like deaminating enzyme